MSSPSSVDEKDRDWRMGDPQVAVESTKEYEPIKSEPKAEDADTDLEANLQRKNSRGTLSRIQSRSSGYTDISTEASSVKSSIVKRKKWYKKLNPLRWGSKPPVPEMREVCPEYQAGFFSMLYFIWMGPLMTVSCFCAHR